MFSKKKKRPTISAPINFEHRVHTGFDRREGKFVGLPPQWASLIQAGTTSQSRPKPIVDASNITNTEIVDLKEKTIVRGSSTTLKPKTSNSIIGTGRAMVARSNSLRKADSPPPMAHLKPNRVPPPVPENEIMESNHHLVYNNHNHQIQQSQQHLMNSHGRGVQLVQHHGPPSQMSGNLQPHGHQVYPMGQQFVGNLHPGQMTQG